MKAQTFAGRAVVRPLGLAAIAWALFGNEDDPQPPADYMPTSSPRWRRICWWGRNPAHNLCFYVLGCRDQDAITVAADPDVVFRDGGWNWGWTFAGWFPRPFVSYQGRAYRGYAGWRPGGALGLKLQHTPKA